ncbi:MAG: DNA-processing protein DprA [Anaerolineales bacterium]|nr:DNA-processing protein DprA [Anaerolineales bacterium]MDW8445743.1 DNA-processing protein DprA [Anaerolineales bacterium]
MVDEREKKYWVGFNLVKGVGAVRFRRLLSRFGTLEQAWHAPLESLRQSGLGDKHLERLSQIRSQVDLNRYWDLLRSKGIQVLTWMDESYPRLLREIDQSPPVLYVRGEITSADEVAVAVVGTRRVTKYGRQTTEEIATGLARNGVTVVSGLARGVDALAHHAALEAGGRTIAVLGNGLDRVYPPEHRRLAEQIVSQGALVSDYPLGTQPDATNFPPRNRIISGLALAVIVVEAGEKSGALITAKFAVEQGRDVFAVPGNIHAPQSMGANRLIQQGAFPFLGISDLLETLNIAVKVQQSSARQALTMDENEACLLQSLSDQPLHVDELSHLCQMPVALVSSTLALLELKGLAKSVGNMCYVVARERGGEYPA